MKLLILALIFTLALAKNCRYNCSRASRASINTIKERSINYNGFTTQKGNHIWAGALGLAWKQLINKFTKKAVRVQTNDVKVLKIISNFNRAQFNAKDIDPRSIYVKSGYGPQTLELINRQSKIKFPKKSFSDLNFQMKETDIISYAYLFKNIEFQKKFTKYKTKNFQFKQVKVEAFYANSPQQMNQIKWLYYQDKDHFMITIKAKNPNDEIYFIKDESINTVDAAIDQVKKFQNQQKKDLGSDDIFSMPIVELDVKRDLQQLLGIKIKNQQLYGKQFKKVFEAVKLRIDQSGAKLENEGAVILSFLSFSSFKSFLFDTDYWVVMKQKSKNPYLCALISNPVDK